MEITTDSLKSVSALKITLLDVDEAKKIAKADRVTLLGYEFAVKNGTVDRDFDYVKCELDLVRIG